MDDACDRDIKYQRNEDRMELFHRVNIIDYKRNMSSTLRVWLKTVLNIPKTKRGNGEF